MFYYDQDFLNAVRKHLKMDQDQLQFGIDQGIEVLDAIRNDPDSNYDEIYNSVKVLQRRRDIINNIQNTLNVSFVQKDPRRWQ